MNAKQRIAKIAGLLYLAIIVCGIFAEFLVRSKLKVSGDAAATAHNIMTSESLFRIGILSDMIMILCDVVLALLFYELLKPVSRSLALLAAFFRLVQAAILGVNLLNLLLVLQFLGGADYLSAFDPAQLQALGLLLLNAHGDGYSIGLVFFGIHCLILGYLVFKSGYFPGILGVLLAFAAIGYLADSGAHFLLSDYASYEAVFTLLVFLPAFIAELSFCLWLLVKGVRLHSVD